MDADWDARYRESPGPCEPAELLAAFAHMLPSRGRALDLACGNGRNSVWLAERGLEVTGLDFSSEALRLGRELAQRRGCSVEWIQKDAESFQFEPCAYDLIVCFNFRSPPLYPKIQTSIRPWGWLIYETYTLAQLKYEFGPRNPEHLLRPGELLAAFAGLRVAYYREADKPRGVAALIAQKMPALSW